MDVYVIANIIHISSFILSHPGKSVMVSNQGLSIGIWVNGKTWIIEGVSSSYERGLGAEMPFNRTNG